jgi:glycosyltransferase involved in cell wall biosynthesis
MMANGAAGRKLLLGHDRSRASSMMSPHTLLIEGWRFVPHSYAIVNQFQCLEFLKEPNLTVRHRDVPYYGPNWKATMGLFDRASEEAIRGIAGPAADQTVDAVFRISVPFNLSPSIGGKTVVFGTAECQCVPMEHVTGNRPLAEACRNCDALIVTPSNWSREGFIRSGADPHRVFVVPHGIDPSIFHPLDRSERAVLRAQHGWNGFIFLNLGSMAMSKGIGVLLKAFATVAQKHPDVRLLMKGSGAVYDSQSCFQTQAASLTPDELSLIRPKMMYFEHTLSFAQMASLYQMADAYVSPYEAEGFNLPVLEAIASGLPVICTRGGPTDEFTTDEFALRVNSVRVPLRPTPTASGFVLKPDFEHLVHQMTVALEWADLADKARAAGPAFVAAGYTWTHVTQRLLKILFDAEAFAQRRKE